VWHRGPFTTIISALGARYAKDKKKKGKLRELAIAMGKFATTAGTKAEEDRLSLE